LAEKPATEAATPRPPSTRLRADAQRNREKLIETAGAAFANGGVQTSLEDIARRAGVGIGTLYRHFPTREHLVEVVYRRELEGLCAAAVELARTHRTDEALAEWMQRLVGYIATKRGMADSLRILMTTKSELFADVAGKLRGALESLLEAAAAEGTIRRDIDATDVMQALSGIYSAPDTPDWRERSRRLVALLMDGLRSGAPKQS
jgi:AcrR family transcriptional regulator